MSWEKILRNRWIVPVLTILVVAAAVVVALKFTQKIGENLAPIRPRVLIFGAEWCRYCPTEKSVQAFANEFPGADVEHIDIDENKALAAKYHIKRVPTIVICDDKGCKIFYSMTAARAFLRLGNTMMEMREDTTEQDRSRTCPWPRVQHEFKIKWRTNAKAN